jgi:hypothetical protein
MFPARFTTTLLLLSLVAPLIAPLPLRAAEIPARDRRDTEVRHVDAHYTMPRYETPQAWKERAGFLKKQILFSAGLWPMPERTPLNPQVFGKVVHEDYSIEKVILETYPGFYLGGNLYRPVGKPGPHPGVVSPHGHWRYGRLEHSDIVSVPGRAIGLARRGFVVFSYDMVGYGDTMQFGHDLQTQPEQLWSIGLLGLQLWDSIRSLDFLTSLSDVDPSRLGATGASGGATQTLLLSAVDERIKFSAPVNMISSIMQGGSACENTANLRIDTNNMEIGSLMAPRPMLMVSATGDWTTNTPQVEFPAVQSIYRLLDAESQLEGVHIDGPHNYNRQSREAVYSFFGRKILQYGDGKGFEEAPFSVEMPSQMLAFWGRPLPANAVTRQALTARMEQQAEDQIRKLHPRDGSSLAEAQDFFREALTLSTLVSIPAAEQILSEKTDELNYRQAGEGELLVIGREGKGDRVPAVLLLPRKPDPAAVPVLIVHPEGTAWVLSAEESGGSLVQEMLARGVPMMGIDAFQTGRAKSSRDVAGAGRYAERFFTTYNRTDAANRIQDILTAIAYLRGRLNTAEIKVVGLGEAGVWSLFARALAGGPIHLAADMAQFETDSDAAYLDRFFIPGLRKAGDFRAALTLLPSLPPESTAKTLLYNTSGSFPSDWAQASFQAAGAGEQLDVRPTPVADAELLEWLAPRRARRR